MKAFFGIKTKSCPIEYLLKFRIIHNLKMLSNETKGFQIENITVINDTYSPSLPEGFPS